MTADVEEIVIDSDEESTAKWQSESSSKLQKNGKNATVAPNSEHRKEASTSKKSWDFLMVSRVITLSLFFEFLEIASE